MSEPHVLATDLVIGESARWHDGRLWLSNWGAQRFSLSTRRASRGRHTGAHHHPVLHRLAARWSTAVVAGPEQRLLRQEPDGSLIDHADLSGLPGGLNEIVVDGRGTIYVNGGTTSTPTRASRPALSSQPGRRRASGR